MSNAAKMQDSFFSLLKVPNFPKLPAKDAAARRRQVLQARLIALGLGQTCGRCGGSGNYSFNHVHGTRCYGCGGSGYTEPKLTPSLFEQTKVKVEQGELDQLIADANLRAQLKRQYTAVLTRVEQANTQTALTYDWMKAASRVQPDRDIADIQHQRCAALDAFRGKCNQVDTLVSYKLRKAQDASARAAITEEVHAAMRDALALADEVIGVFEAGVIQEKAARAKWDGAPEAPVFDPKIEPRDHYLERVQHFYEAWLAAR